MDFESPKYYLGEHAPDPSRSFCLGHLFRKSVTIYPRSVPVLVLFGVPRLSTYRDLVNIWLLHKSVWLSFQTSSTT